MNPFLQPLVLIDMLDEPACLGRFGRVLPLLEVVLSLLLLFVSGNGNGNNGDADADAAAAAAAEDEDEDKDEDEDDDDDFENTPLRKMLSTLYDAVCSRQAAS